MGLSGGRWRQKIQLLLRYYLRQREGEKYPGFSFPPSHLAPITASHWSVHTGSQLIWQLAGVDLLVIQSKVEDEQGTDLRADKPRPNTKKLGLHLTSLSLIPHLENGDSGSFYA